MNLLSTITDRLRQVTEDGDGLLALCPAHSDHEPSLRVAVTEEGKVLMVCRAGCSFQAVSDAIGVDPSAYYNVTADVEGIKPASSGHGDLPIQAQALLGAYMAKTSQALTPHALEYASKRFGVDDALAGDLGLGFDDGTFSRDFPWVGQAYQGAPRLVVPFRDFEGVPRGFQSRDLTGQAKVKWAGPSNPETGSWAKWGFMDSGSGQDFVMVTEGPGDAMSSVAAGIDAVLIRGAMVAKNAAQDLVEPLQGRRVILGGDNDKAGQAFNDALGSALSEAGIACHVIEVPEKYGDLSEWFEAQPETFATDYQAAVFRAPAWVRSQEKEIEQEEALVRLNTSDVGVARLVVEFFDSRLAYTPGLGFFLYEDGVWQKDELNRTRLTIYEVSDHYAALAEEHRSKGTEKDDALSESYSSAARRLSSTKAIDQVTKELQVLTAITLDRYDRQPRLLCVRNGVVDLRTGELLDHSPDFYLTQKVDVDFFPEAEAPRWEAFLREVFPGDQALPDYIRRLIGYGITGETVEQCFAVLWGRGANGKSVFTDTLSHVFEGITKTTPFSTFEEKVGGGIPNDVAALRGARLVFASEGEQGKPMAESVIKRVTGQDLITARFMREEFFSFRPSFLILLATNHKPSFRSMDAGLWRRVKLLPWARFFAEDERDHYLTQALKEEAEGILAWAVRGAIEWNESGLGDPETVIAATKTYRDTSDRLSGFFPEILRQERGSTVKAPDAFRYYISWAEAEELPTKEIWNRNTFYAALEERGVDRVKRKVGMVLLDVTLDPAPIEPQDPDLDAPIEGLGGAR